MFSTHMCTGTADQGAREAAAVPLTCSIIILIIATKIKSNSKKSAVKSKDHSKVMCVWDGGGGGGVQD